MSEVALAYPALPVGGVRRLGVGWWGVLCVLLTEGALFAYLLFSYGYCAVQLDPSWRPGGLPSLWLAGPNTLVLILSSVAVAWGERGARLGRRRRLLIGVGIGLLLGALFVAIQLMEWHSRPFTLRSSLYGSLFFTITGFHMAHVVVGLLALAVVLLWSALGYFDARRKAPVLIVSIYWHFVDVVWIFVFTTLYLTPYLG
jgi:cytochrome c oxidase subunit III